MDDIPNGLKLRPLDQEQAQREQPTCSSCNKVNDSCKTIGGMAVGGSIESIPGVALGGTIGTAIGDTLLCNRQAETTPSPQTKEMTTLPPCTPARLLPISVKCDNGVTFTMKISKSVQVYSKLSKSDQDKIKEFFEGTPPPKPPTGKIDIEGGRKIAISFSKNLTDQQYTINKLILEGQATLQPTAEKSTLQPAAEEPSPPSLNLDALQPCVAVSANFIEDLEGMLNRLNAPKGSVKGTEFERFVEKCVMQFKGRPDIEISEQAHTSIRIKHENQDITIGLWKPHGSVDVIHYNTKGVGEPLEILRRICFVLKED